MGDGRLEKTMSLLDTVKKTAAKILSESDLGKQAVALLQEAVQKIEGNSVEILSNQDVYRTKISDPTYVKLPGVLQSLLTPEQWHDFLYVAKDSFFLIQSGRLHLQPGFKAGVNDFVRQLMFGRKALKPSEATVDVKAVELPPKGANS
jgi:hypothetical protein